MCLTNLCLRTQIYIEECKILTSNELNAQLFKKNWTIILEQMVTLVSDSTPRCHIGSWLRIKYKEVSNSALPLSL